METRRTCALHDLVDDIEFLATLLVKENAESYQQTDYLRLNNQCSGSVFRLNSEQTFPCFGEKHNSSVKWEMSSAGRLQVGQWFYQMTCSFGFPISFAFIAMNYFDRMLSRSNSLSGSKSEIQLLALTCFYLSVKLFQTGPILSIEQISLISGFVYSSKEIVSMEQMILRELKWCLYPPLASDYLRPYLNILLSDTCFYFGKYCNEIMNLSHEMTNVVAMDYFFVANQFLPSHVAVAIIINAISTVLPFSDFPTVHEITNVLSHITGYSMKENEVFMCCERIWGLMNINNQTIVDVTRSIPITLGHAQIDHRPRSPTPHSPIAVSSSFAVHRDTDTHLNKTYEHSSSIQYSLSLPSHCISSQNFPNETLLRL